jgi:ribosomal protein L7/L12
MWVARKTLRFRRVFLIHLGAIVVAIATTHLAWLGVSKLWSVQPAAVVVLAAGVLSAITALVVRRVHRGGNTVGGVVRERRQRARALVDTAEKLHARAPVGAGLFAVASFPAAIIALVAAPRAGGLTLPPPADARLQLWCIGAIAVVAVLATDGWLGFGVSLRALATDGFTAGVAGWTIALAAAPALMIIWPVHVRAVWLTVGAALLVWSFGGLFVGSAVCEARKRRLWRLGDSAFAPAAALPDEQGMYDLVLVSSGARKIQVIRGARTVTRLGLKEAKDLIDNAPGVVLHHVTRERADRAADLLESLGATVTITTDSTTRPVG